MFANVSNTSLAVLWLKFDSFMKTQVPFGVDSGKFTMLLSSYLLFVNTFPLDKIKKSSINLELKKIPSPEWFSVSVVNLPLNNSQIASSIDAK